MKKKPPQKKRIKHEIRTDYLGNVYGKDFLKKLPEAAKILRGLKRKLKFDAIAFRGTSGAGFAFPLSYLLRIPVINVRKGSSHYTGGAIEGTLSSRRYIIVDDFIESGNTIKTIRSTIRKELKGRAVAVGIFLYSSGRTSNFSNLPVYSMI